MGITGYEYFEYDAMGNVSESDKYIVVPTESMAYNLVTRYRYDSFGRMRSITYPDGEEVNYNYWSGLLYSVANTEGETYIQSIVYDEYNTPIQTTYGNGIVSRSSYDAVHHRLAWRELQSTYHASQHETQYEYDGVGNITHIRQHVSSRGGLGGKYAVAYGYDEQNRLLNARQYNSEIGDYSYFMSYSPSGLVRTKESPQLNADMVFGYRYDGEYISHQPKMIYSVSDDEDVTLLGWNTNGQMTSMVQLNQDRFRKHLWDEAGQLAVAIGNEYCGYYGYNANGERVYKLMGTVLADQYDAGDVNIETYFDDIVLYVNPYMVVTPRGYTKHYYNGNERIAARLGDYWYDAGAMGGGYEKEDLAREVLEDRLNSGNTDEEYFEEEYYYSEEIGDIWCEPYTLRTTYSSCTYVEDMLYSVFDGGTRMADEMYGIDKGIFYYHSDHLGSASWITDDQGNAVQYIHYMPYGELWLNQQANSYDERFKFTSKERDTETGYDYYGARYYSSMLGHWLSVDKLADDYPHITPYAQSAWNPIKYVDTDGMDYTVAVDGDTKTITIQATYYTNSDDYESAEVAAEFWNKNSGKYSYTEKKETYTINFDLKVEDSHDNLGADMSAQSDISGQANRYTVGDYGLKATENGATYNGNAVRVRNSRRLTDTGAHEIGHTLGLAHSDYGIMTPSSNDSHRGTNNMPEFIENIISNAIHPTNNGQIGKATIISPHSLKGYGHVRKIK